MSIKSLFLQALVEFASIFNPISDALDHEGEGIEDLLANFGWTLGSNTTAQQASEGLHAIVAAISAAREAASTLSTSNTAAASAIPDPKQLIDAVKSVVNLVKQLEGGHIVDFYPFDGHFRVDELLEYLVYTYVECRFPRVFGVMYVLGVFYEEPPKPPEPPEPPELPHRTPCLLKRVRWGMLGIIATSPQTVFKGAYGWSEDEAQDVVIKGLQQLIVSLCIALDAFGFPAIVGASTVKEREDAFADNNEMGPDALKLTVALFQSIESGEEPSVVYVDLIALPALSHLEAVPAQLGLLVYPSLKGTIGNQDITLSDNVTLQIAGKFQGATPIRMVIYPGGAVVRDSSLGDIDATLCLVANPGVDDPWILIGSKDSTRIWLAKAHICLEAHGPGADPEIVIEIGVDQTAFVLDFSEGDGFLQRIFGEKPQVIELSTLARWSSHRGLTIGGQATFDFLISLHQSIGEAIRLDSILIRMTGNGTTASIQFGISGGLRLGPIAGSVDRVGIEATFGKADNGGNLGPMNLDLGFKPPDGLGMVVDATVVIGGGYLFCDRERGEYAGVLQLEIAKKLAVKAIGLLTTKLPDRPNGFSLLVIITAEFPPIQLGYGFSLNGLGGLLGIHRTMVLEVLREGVKTGILNSIMFPKDPVANAPQILSDLRSVFPPSEGRYVFGPMAKLGWGASVVTVDLGIIIELPTPVRLALMGRITLLLPPGVDQGLVRLQMDILGTLDFDKGDAGIDATLYDSRITTFPVSGDMALRLNWGASPTFAMAAGGFNPRFTPPPSFPALDRLAISLSDSDNPCLRLEAYMALTANTLQFGSRLDVYFAAGPFSASANMGFDALMEFSPFYFSVDIEGQASVKFKGEDLLVVDLKLLLEGPAPWHAYGRASFEICFVKGSVELDFTTGDDSSSLPLRPEDPLKDLTSALDDYRNWNARLPDGGHPLVTLREIPVEEVAEQVIMHPFGDLTVRQRVVPLDVDINRYGGAPLDETRKFHIESITFGDGVSAKFDEVRDAFAPAQFYQLSDDEKLSAPAFQSLPAGCTTIRPDQRPSLQPLLENWIEVEPQYDTVVIDKKDQGNALPKLEDQPPAYTIRPDNMSAAARIGAAARSQMRRTGSDKFMEGPVGRVPSRVAVRDPQYHVVNMDNLQPSSETPFGSHLEATQVCRKQGVGRQVVGVHEV